MTTIILIILLKLFILFPVCLTDVKMSHDLIEKHIYYQFPDEAIIYCMKHQDYETKTGCNSDPNGNEGIIIEIKSSLDLEMSLVKFSEHEKYIVMIDFQLYLDYNILIRLRSVNFKPWINGIVVLEPNNKSIYCTSWKNCHFGVLHIEWPFPIIIIRAKSDYQDRIMNCANRTHHGQLCAMNILYPQYENVSESDCETPSETGFTRYFDFIKPEICEKYSMTNHYVPISNAKTIEEYILIMVRIDTQTMYHNAAYGRRSIMPTVAGVLGLIDKLMNTEDGNKSQSNNLPVLVAFLDNEELHCTGSNILYQDLKNGNIKFGQQQFTLNKIKFSFYLDHLTKNKSLYLVGKLDHLETFRDFLGKDFKKRMKPFSLKIFDQTLTNTDIHKHIGMSFRIHYFGQDFNMIAIRDNCDDFSLIESISFINDQEEYTNTISAVIKGIAFLYNVITNKSAENVESLKTNVWDNMKCFNEPSKCPLYYSKMSTSLRIHIETFKYQFQYTSDQVMNNKLVSSRFSDILGDMLILKLGETNIINLPDCKKTDFKVKWFNQVACYRINYMRRNGFLSYNTSNTASSLRYKGKLMGPASTCLYLRSDPKIEVMLLVFGTIFTVISFVGVIFIKNHIYDNASSKHWNP